MQPKGGPGRFADTAAHACEGASDLTHTKAGWRQKVRGAGFPKAGALSGETWSDQGISKHNIYYQTLQIYGEQNRPVDELCTAGNLPSRRTVGPVLSSKPSAACAARLTAT